MLGFDKYNVEQLNHLIEPINRSAHISNHPGYHRIIIMFEKTQGLEIGD